MGERVRNVKMMKKRPRVTYRYPTVSYRHLTGLWGIWGEIWGMRGVGAPYRSLQASDRSLTGLRGAMRFLTVSFSLIFTFPPHSIPTGLSQ